MKAETLMALLDHKDELDDLTRPAPRRSYGETLSASLSNWEIEEAYARHKAGVTLSVLSMQYHVGPEHLRRAFGKLEERAATVG